MIFVDFFASLMIHLTVRGNKIILVPLPGKFVTVPVDVHFIIALSVKMGIFRWVATFQ